MSNDMKHQTEGREGLLTSEAAPVRRDGILITLGAVISGLSGLCSLLIVVFYGGALVEKVRALDGRVADMELHAAPVTREHMAVDDARDAEAAKQTAEVVKRVEKVEAMSVTVLEIKGQMNLNSYKLDEMVKSIDRVAKHVDELSARKP